MGSSAGAIGRCLDEEGVIAFLQARLPREGLPEMDEHLDRCGACQKLVAEAATALRDSRASVDAEAVSETTFSAGERVADRYQVIRFIARGGMGEVYEVQDETLRTRVALKTVAATIADDWRAMERLKTEVQLARRVAHPNVYRTFDLGVHNRRTPAGQETIHFLTMELLPGETLGRRLRRHGRMPPAEVIPLLKQMMGALAAAHGAGIVHRDFKSDNVMLMEDRVVVMDFGLARTTQGGWSPVLTVGSGAFVGSVAYMAPEQVEGLPVTTAADIYALGVVLFEMLTGQLPFVGNSPLATAAKRLNQPPPSLRLLVPALDARWDRLVRRCLERSPSRRWERIGDMEDAVAELEGATRMWGPGLRGRRAFVLAGGVIAGGGALAWARMQWGRGAQDRAHVRLPGRPAGPRAATVDPPARARTVVVPPDKDTRTTAVPREGPRSPRPQRRSSRPASDPALVAPAPAAQEENAAPPLRPRFEGVANPFIE